MEEATKILLEKKILEVLENETYIDRREGNEIGYEIFVNYDEKISDRGLKEISQSDDPLITLEERLNEWVFNAEDYYYPELIKILEKEIPGYDEYENFITDWLREHVYWYLPDEVKRQSVKVTIALDTGDLNYDFTKCNILNWYGTVDLEEGETPKLPDDSPIYHLAKQQGKLEELQIALKDITRQSDANYSQFTKTMLQEMQNACSHMNVFVFLAEMELIDFIKLREMIDEEKPLNDSYYYEDRKGTKTITIKKNAMCGLYDVWGGGGSVLEVKLEKDVELPIKAIWDAWIEGSNANGRGYDVDEVYGLIGSCWRDVVDLKEEA